MYIPYEGARGIGRRMGWIRTVRGRSEGNRKEKRLLYSKYLKLQFMRSRNRERDLAYVAWKGEAWGIGRRKGCFQINSRILHNVAERPFVACHLKLRLFPPVASTNVLLSGLPWAQHNYQNLPFLESPFRVRNIVTSNLLATSKARMKRANMRANQDLENRRDFGEHAAEGGNNCGFDEHTIEGGNKRDFGEHATVGGNKKRNFGEHATIGGNKRELYPPSCQNTRDFDDHATRCGNKCDFGKHATKGGNKRDFGERARELSTKH